MRQDELFPEIDWKKTRKNAERAIEKYRMYLLSIDAERMPKITASYSLVPPTNTNVVHSSTEDVAIHNVDYERERTAYIERFAKAVNKLPQKERQAIIMKYMGDEELFDYEVYNELGVGETYYYTKFKPKMLNDLAMALNIVVFKEKK